MTTRLLHIVVHPVLVDDDGENLTPGPPTQPQVLTLAQAVALLATLPEQIDALNTEVADG